MDLAPKTAGAASDTSLPSPGFRSTASRYGLAVGTFLLATAVGVVLDHFGFRNEEVPLYLFAVAITAWYGGSGPAAVSVTLSILFFDYYFVEPRYSFYATTAEIPYLLVFIAFASLVAWFSSVRRRVERDLIIARDHLQLEVAERTRQANLLNLTHDMIFVRDMNSVINYWNRGATELYGYSAEQALGQRSHELLHTVFPAPLEEIVDELMRTDRWEGELTHTKADGNTVTVLSRWALQRDEQLRPAAVLETNNDITDRKRREREIENLNDQLASRSQELESTNKELEAFAYSVSHDLRAPLRHMSGYAEMLQKRIASALDEKSQRYLRVILESAQRMGNLIDDLLAFSRIGRAETQRTQVNLNQLVKEALVEVKQEAAGRNITWKIDSLPLCYGDRSMLRLVLVNLLTNAVKFTRPREHAVIEVGCEDGHKHEVVVFVRDNGAGFDMKYANKLFGVFQRLHQAETFEGTGIGLATVQRVIHRLGGNVRAEGAVDQGATFYFSVPRA